MTEPREGQEPGALAEGKREPSGSHPGVSAVEDAVSTWLDLLADLIVAEVSREQRETPPRVSDPSSFSKERSER